MPKDMVVGSLCRWNHPASKFFHGRYAIIVGINEDGSVVIVEDMGYRVTTLMADYLDVID